MYDFRWLKELYQGKRVLGVPVYKTAVLLGPTGSSINLFTVAGGRVSLERLTGEIIVVPVVAAGTSLVRLRYALAGIGVGINMCTDSGDLSVMAANELLTITGAVAVGMVDAGVTGLQLVFSFATNKQALEPGIINMLQTNAGANVTAGSIKWTLHYVPLDPGATISPA